jgi:hypothetical protein
MAPKPEQSTRDNGLAGVECVAHGKHCDGSTSDCEPVADVLEVQACQVRVGDYIVRERFRSTSGIVRRLAQPNPGDVSVGFYLSPLESPRWFDPEEMVRVRRLRPGNGADS